MTTKFDNDPTIEDLLKNDKSLIAEGAGADGCLGWEDILLKLAIEARRSEQTNGRHKMETAIDYAAVGWFIVDNLYKHAELCGIKEENHVLNGGRCFDPDGVEI